MRSLSPEQRPFTLGAGPLVALRLYRFPMREIMKSLLLAFLLLPVTCGYSENQRRPPVTNTPRICYMNEGAFGEVYEVGRGLCTHIVIPGAELQKEIDTDLNIPDSVRIFVQDCKEECEFAQSWRAPKLIVSIGASTPSSVWRDLEAAEVRSRLKEFIIANGVDGVDFAWIQPDLLPSDVPLLVKILQETRRALPSSASFLIEVDAQTAFSDMNVRLLNETLGPLDHVVLRTHKMIEEAFDAGMASSSHLLDLRFTFESVVDHWTSGFPARQLAFSISPRPLTMQTAEDSSQTGLHGEKEAKDNEKPPTNLADTSYAALRGIVAVAIFDIEADDVEGICYQNYYRRPFPILQAVKDAQIDPYVKFPRRGVSPPKIKTLCSHKGGFDNGGALATLISGFFPLDPEFMEFMPAKTSTKGCEELEIDGILMKSESAEFFNDLGTFMTTTYFGETEQELKIIDAKQSMKLRCELEFDKFTELPKSSRDAVFKQLNGILNPQVGAADQTLDCGLMLSSERREEFGEYLAEFNTALATLSRDSCSRLKVRIRRELEESHTSSFFGFTSKHGYAKHYAYNASAISQASNSRFIQVTERVPSLALDNFPQADDCRPAFAVACWHEPSHSSEGLSKIFAENCDELLIEGFEIRNGSVGFSTADQAVLEAFIDKTNQDPSLKKLKKQAVFKCRRSGGEFFDLSKAGEETINKIKTFLQEQQLDGAVIDCYEFLTKDTRFWFWDFIGDLNKALMKNRCDSCSRLSIRISPIRDVDLVSGFDIRLLNELRFVYFETPLPTKTSRYAETLVDWKESQLDMRVVIMPLSANVFILKPNSSANLGEELAVVQSRSEFCKEHIAPKTHYGAVSASLTTVDGDWVTLETNKTVKYKVFYALKAELGGVSLEGLNADRIPCGEQELFSSLTALRKTLDDNY